MKKNYQIVLPLKEGSKYITVAGINHLGNHANLKKTKQGRVGKPLQIAFNMFFATI